MGARGPAPAPTALKALKGQRVKNKREPVPDLKVPPAPPDHLLTPGCEAALAIWERLAPDMWAKGVLTWWDRDAFAVWCTAVATHAEATKDVATRGVVVKTHNGQVKNPALQVQRDSATTILQFGGRFGLTPSDRQALVMDDAEEKNDARRLLA